MSHVIVYMGLFIPGVVASQETNLTALPRFEEVSIRKVPPHAPPTLRSQKFTPVLPGGRFLDSRTNLTSLISFAFSIRSPSIQLVGLPRWAKEYSYSVSAKASDNYDEHSSADNVERVRLMVRSMLSDRFALTAHSETRQEQVFSLRVAKSGIRVKEVDPPVPPAEEGPVNAAMGDSGGRMIGQSATMAGMARALAIFLKQPVVDDTGLRGYYDFDVRWSAPELSEGQSRDALGTEGLGLLISVLKNEFGLEVKRRNGGVTYLLVDRVQLPTDN